MVTKRTLCTYYGRVRRDCLLILLVYQITLFLTLLITVMLKVNLVGEFINTPMLDTCLLVVRSAMPSRHDSLTFTRNPPEAVTAC